MTTGNAIALTMWTFVGTYISALYRAALVAQMEKNMPAMHKTLV